MNCKPGDLAVVVYDACGYHTGKIVTCLRLETGRNWSSPTWVTEPTLIDPNGARCHAADETLRPITPPPGTVTDSEVLELYSPKQRETV